MQQYLQALNPRDRSLLALRIGIQLPKDNTSPASSSNTAQQANGGSLAASSAAGPAVVSAADEQQGMSLEQLAKHFNVKSRQRAHQLMEAAVVQLRQRLQAAASQDAQVAQLLGLAGSSTAEQ
jgi:DNA-directed RNA polymerase sigma subunit (sigma70/sigma32)